MTSFDSPQVVEMQAAVDAVALVEGLLRGTLVVDKGVKPRAVVREEPELVGAALG